MKKLLVLITILCIATTSYAFAPEPIIQETIDTMAGKGFDACEVTVSAWESANGYYNYQEDFIGLYPAYVLPMSVIKYRDQCVRTFLHEYGHYVWFHLTDEQRQQYKDSREWTHEGYFDNPVEMFAEEWAMLTALRNGIYFKRRNLRYMYRPVMEVLK